MNINNILPALAGQKSPLELLNEFYLSHSFKSLYNNLFQAIDSTDEAVFSRSSEVVFNDFLINEYGKILSDKMPLVQTIKKDNFLNQLDIKA
jgi:hypothetical protein